MFHLKNIVDLNIIIKILAKIKLNSTNTKYEISPIKYSFIGDFNLKLSSIE